MQYQHSLLMHQEGGGKIALQPNYLISQSADKVVLRNFEGVITTYPEPESYIPGRAEGYFKEIYPNYEENVQILVSRVL